jgi:Cu+-exporting ATPase
MSTPTAGRYVGGIVNTMAIAIDPVCGMSVETEGAKLTLEYEGTTYYFCGKGCLLEFKDDPERFLAADHKPSM